MKEEDLPQNCDCGHSISRHSSGPTARRGCKTCKCKKWYRLKSPTTYTEGEVAA